MRCHAGNDNPDVMLDLNLEEENLGIQMWDFVRKPLHSEIITRGERTQGPASRGATTEKGVFIARECEDGATVCGILKSFLPSLGSKIVAQLLPRSL